MRIALAREADVGALLALANQAAAHSAANFATEPESLASWTEQFVEHSALYPWIVARAHDLVLGFAKIAPHHARGGYAWTADITVYVAEEHHRRGVGKALYGALIPLARAQGYRVLVGGITSPNPASEGLHEQFGFTRFGTLRSCGFKFGQWHDVGWWSLDLRPCGEAEILRSVLDVVHSHDEFAFLR